MNALKLLKGLKRDLVRYHPGSEISGSPGWMPRKVAELYLARDTAQLEKLVAINAVTLPVVWPRIQTAYAK